MSLSSAFTIEDLERARKYNGHLTRFCGLNEEPCNKCWDYAILIAQVRAEAQEALWDSHCPSCNTRNVPVSKGHGCSCAPSIARVESSNRLAAAEKLAQLADILIEDAERAANPQARLLCYRELKDARDKLRGL